MVLPTGTISMSQVNTELGRSSTASISLGETAVRTLAGVPSGAISMDNLRGKSNSETQTVTSGAYYDEFGNAVRGYSSNLGIGSISDGTFGFISNATIKNLSSENGSTIVFELVGTYSNSGFTSMVLAGVTYNRTSAAYVASGGTTYWSWGGGNDPFSPEGTVRAVVFNA